MSLEATMANLEKMATDIKAEVGGILTACRTALGHARNVGSLLRDAKKLVRKIGGGWEVWVLANCPFGPKTASNYMRLAREWADLNEHPNFNSETTVSQALKLLAVCREAPVPASDKGSGDLGGGLESGPIPLGYRVALATPSKAS